QSTSQTFWAVASISLVNCNVFILYQQLCAQISLIHQNSSLNNLSYRPSHTSPPHTPAPFASGPIDQTSSFRGPCTYPSCSVCFLPHTAYSCQIHRPAQVPPHSLSTAFYTAVEKPCAIRLSAL